MPGSFGQVNPKHVFMAPGVLLYVGFLARAAGGTKQGGLERPIRCACHVCRILNLLN